MVPLTAPLSLTLALAPLLSPDPPPILRLTPGIPDTLHPADLVPGGASSVRVIDPAGLLIAPLESGALRIELPPTERGIRLPRLRLDDRPLTLPVIAAPKRPVLFRLDTGAESVESVFLFGTMNRWNRESTPLADANRTGWWERTVPLVPGRYEYKFWVDGKERLDPTASERVPNGFGGFNNLLIVPPLSTGTPPRLRFGPWTALPPDAARLDIRLYRADAPDAAPRLIALFDDALLPPAAIHPQSTGFAIELSDDLASKWRQGRHTLRLIYDAPPAHSNLLRLDLDAGRPAGSGPSPSAGKSSNFRWRDAILYSLVTDRFRNGDPRNDAPVTHPELAPRANWLGGDLQGVRWAIESGYFDSLSVDALWISPVSRAPANAYREHPPPHRFYSGYHGYWPTAPRAAEPRFGGIEALRDLVGTAHGRGMAVLLDQVTNHVHQDHPYFSEHPEWFGDLLLPDGRPNLRLFDEQRLTTWFEPYLPSFDYMGSDDALRASVDDALWWLEESGADGFRHDATKHVPHRFWRVLTGAIARRVEPKRGRRVFQIGETFGSDELVASYVNPGQQNAQFDFSTYYIVRAALLDTTRSMGEVGRRMQTAWRHFGAGHLMGNLIDSHDQVRFASFADGDIPPGADDKELGWTEPLRNDHPLTLRRVQLFLAWILTAPGLPVLYYGDEIAMAGAGDPDNRRPMRFGAELTPEERAHLRETRRWTALRREHIALRRGDFELLLAEDDLLVFERNHPLERIIVLLNRADGSRQVDTRPIRTDTAGRAPRARDLLSGEELFLEHGDAVLTVPPVSARVLRFLPGSE
ncbi:MAG: hypothetical protein CME06_11950 [Gemmatimonadetes bacterium]|nr:hypothetical protein [Gemmatimonadota bacterium]